MKEVINRAKAPTPKFFKVLRTVGICLAAAGGTIIAAPVVLPTAVISVGGYILVAGTVLGAVSQVAKKEE